MSAISAIYRLDNSPVSESEIEFQLEVMRHRGDDGCERTLLFGLFLVNQYFGVEFPVNVLDNENSDRAFRLFGDKIYEQLFSESPMLMESSFRYSYHLELKPKYWDRLKLRYFRMAYLVKVILRLLNLR